MSDNTSRLPILKDENFRYWKSQIFSYCMEKNLDGFLLGDKAALASDANKESWADKKVATAGILGRHLSEDNIARFITEENQREPHLIWEALKTHFESNSSQNQAKVYQKFLKISFKSTLRDFLTQVNNSVASMRAVGLKIREPTAFKLDVNKNLLAKHIVRCGARTCRRGCRRP